MRSPGLRAKAHPALFRTLFLLSLLALTACADSGSSDPGTGSLAFRAVWPSAPEAGAVTRATTEEVADVCTTFGIETITAVVLDADDAERGNGSWPCDTEGHRGTIDEIPVGSGYRVRIEGTVGEIVRWRGEAADITIVKDATAVADRVVMHSLDHLLTASSSAGGRIEPAGQIAFADGGEQRFAFTADSGYAIGDVVVDGVSVEIQDSYTFSDIDGNHSLYVSFTPTASTATHTITASAGEGGEIVPSGDIAVVADSDQTFWFAPAAGGSVLEVFVDGDSQGAISSYTFTGVAADHTITVAFDTTTHTVTATAGTGGSIDPAGAVSVGHGATPSFTISSTPGHFLSELLIGGRAVTPESPITLDPVIADTTIEARFTPVHHVAADASAGGDGQTWETAFATVAEAIVAAAEGDEIWVQAGTYPLTNFVSVNKAVAIYGGFSGTESYRHQRDWEARPTILDGQADTRCVDLRADARLDGLTIHNGLVDDGYANLQGGGLYMADCAPTLVNCTFTDNAVNGSNSCLGGAVYADNSNPRFENCRFENNTLGCEVGSGGAMHMNASNTTLVNSRFFNNRITWGLGGAGGAIKFSGGGATITGCDFIENSTSANGTSGGAVDAADADLQIDASRFLRNRSLAGHTATGGAIDLSGAATAAGSRIQNTLFLGNSTHPDGAPNNASGGALYLSNTDPEIVNCTFTDNFVIGFITGRGGAIANVSASPTITNTILWDNTAQLDDGTTISDGEGFQIYDDAGSSATVSFSAIDQDGYAGNNNLREDPHVDAAGHLRPASPCRDQGDDAAAPAADIDDDTRPAGTQSDIGADEFIDADNDDMPDYWEDLYDLDSGEDDGAADADGDGLTNLYEYQNDLDPSVANPVLNAIQRGWYDDSGFHDAADDATRCSMEGGTEHRAYFSFDLSAFDGSAVITGAHLRLELVQYFGIRPSEAIDVYAVTTPAATLEASASGQTAIYDDLGDGTPYAESVTISPAYVGMVVEIPLSAAAADEVESAQGGPFSVGIRSALPAMGEDDLFTFSQGAEARTHQLILVVE